MRSFASSLASAGLASLVAAALAGCGSAPLPDGQLAPSAPSAGADEVGVPAVALPIVVPGASWLVWTRSATGRTLTHRLDAEGRETASHDGVRLAVDGAEWIWATERIEVPTSPCALADDAAPVDDPLPGHATRVTLRPLAGGDARVVVAGPAVADAAELEHGATLVASVGSLVFVRESTWVYACGAHGSTSASALVWDAARGAPVDLSRELGALDVERQRAREAFDVRADDDGSPFLDEGEGDEAPAIDFAELVPRWDGARGLALGVRMTTSTCYACSDGQWSSYTTSVVVDAARAPRSLAGANRALPAAVRTFASHLEPGETIGGFGELASR